MQVKRKFRYSTASTLAAIVLAPLVAGGLAEAAPVIFWSNDPVGPDDTVMVTGDDLGRVDRVGLVRLPDGSGETASSARSIAVTPVQVTQGSLKFTLPKDVKSGVYRYTVESSDGTASALINSPTFYWAQGDGGTYASRDGWVRVLGRNIARNQNATLSMHATNNDYSVEIKVDKADLWDGRFRVPSTMKDGAYRLSIWNGEGDRTTIRDAGQIKIASKPAEPAKSVRVTDYGALGNGSADDTKAIQNAIKAAGANGAAVYFPRGRYLLSASLEVPPGVQLIGAARELVSLNWLSFHGAPPAALIWGTRDFSVRNLTIFATNFTAVISGGFTGADPRQPLGNAANILIDNVLVRVSSFRGHITQQQMLTAQGSPTQAQAMNSPVAFQLTGSNLKILHSDVYSSGGDYFLLKPKGAYVADNKFYVGRFGWNSITGAQGVIFERNTIQGADLNSSGGGINTLWGMASSQNALFYDNTFSLMHGWDREAVTTDGPGGYYYGGATAPAKDRLTLNAASFTPGRNRELAGAGLFIVDGRGTGQYATITSFDGSSVKLDRALQVTPDATSVVAIVAMQQNYIFSENSFADTGIGVQLYGTVINSIVSGNTSTRSGGFVDRGLLYRHFQPSWYNQFLSNQVLEGNIYDAGEGRVVPEGSSVGAYCYALARKIPPLCRGLVIRGNVLKNNAQIVVHGGRVVSEPGLVGAVVEKNTVMDSTLSVDKDAGVKDVLERDNSLEGNHP